jgi:large subunit ribosomal protein L3
MKIRALLGRKIGMTQLFTEDGEVVPVSVMTAGPCVVLEKKIQSGKDGYSAIKVGFETRKDKHVTKPEMGYFKKLDVAPARFVREVRMPEEQVDEIEVGGTLDVSIFAEGDIVNVSGKSKGRGFAGVMKRYGFSGMRATHGTHSSFRGPGAIGCSAWPGRVWKGKKMPGQYGNVIRTIENLEVVKVIPEDNMLLIRGSIPGHRNSLLVVKNSPKKWKRS